MGTENKSFLDIGGTARARYQTDHAWKIFSVFGFHQLQAVFYIREELGGISDDDMDMGINTQSPAGRVCIAY